MNWGPDFLRHYTQMREHDYDKLCLAAVESGKYEIVKMREFKALVHKPTGAICGFYIWTSTVYTARNATDEERKCYVAPRLASWWVRQ